MENHTGKRTIKISLLRSYYYVDFIMFYYDIAPTEQANKSLRGAIS